MIGLFNPEKRHQISWFLAILSVGLLAFQLSFSAATYDMHGDLVGMNSASAIGVGAAVGDNGINSLAADLEKRSGELNERERSLAAREAALGEEYRAAIAENNRLTIYVLASVTVFLIFLIGLNFYMDYKRAQRGDDDAPMVHRHGELQTRL